MTLDARPIDKVDLWCLKWFRVFLYVEAKAEWIKKQIR